MKKEIESIDDIFKSIRDAPHGKFLLQLEKSIRQYDKQGSILFAEWILKESILPRDNCWFDAGKHLTSKELYELFKKQNNE